MAEEQNKTAPEQNEACECENPKKEAKKSSKKEKELLSKIETLEGELASQKDSYLRLCAEYDNYRKRTAKEKTDIYSNATSKAVEDLLPVIDNFDRAIAAQGENIDQGLMMIYSQFQEYLTKLGVCEMVDEKFDPTRHIAVMHVEDPNLDNNQIVEVFQKGYTLGDKTIRLACVKVAN